MAKDFIKLEEALEKIVENQDEPALDYCVRYAMHALKMVRNKDSYEDVRHQILYVMSNLDDWRGDTAKEVRAVIKEFIKH